MTNLACATWSQSIYQETALPCAQPLTVCSWRPFWRPNRRIWCFSTSTCRARTACRLVAGCCAASGVPFIMLTAAGDPVDRVIGLELGADDYIAKPFDLRELRARVRSVLRRTARPIASNASGAAVASGERVSFGAVALDLAARCLLHPDGRVSKLTAMEFDLLRTFAENPNRVLTRDRLLDLAHHRDLEPFDRSIDIRVARLPPQDRGGPRQTAGHQDYPRLRIHVRADHNMS